MSVTWVVTDVSGPPLPFIQVSVKAVVPVIAFVALFPDRPRFLNVSPPPESEHAVALRISFQYKVVVLPSRTRLGSA